MRLAIIDCSVSMIMLLVGCVAGACIVLSISLSLHQRMYYVSWSDSSCLNTLNCFEYRNSLNFGGSACHDVLFSWASASAPGFVIRGSCRLLLPES